MVQDTPETTVPLDTAVPAERTPKSSPGTEAKQDTPKPVDEQAQEDAAKIRETSGGYD